MINNIVYLYILITIIILPKHKTMKATNFLFLILLSICMLGCDECDVDVDPAATPVCFIVKDMEGNNLLDPQFEGNILNTGIEVTHNGEKYPLILSESNYREYGLYTGKIGEDEIPGILFCYFYINRDKGGDKFSISWNDGITDTIKFDYYYTVKNCDTVSHIRIYLNDKLQSTESLTVTIIKE